MENNIMFEKATRGKFRFPYKGSISVEELWDLRVEELDLIYKVLNKQIKLETEDSLLDVKTATNDLTNTKIDIVKYIVEIKQAEKLKLVNEKNAREERQKIMSILSFKENEELQNMTIEELNAMLNKTN